MRTPTPETGPVPADYEWIRHWGQMQGSWQSYVINQQVEACSDGAPLDAIYRDSVTRQWETLRDVTNLPTLSRLSHLATTPEHQAQLAQIIAKLTDPASVDPEGEHEEAGTRSGGVGPAGASPGRRTLLPVDLDRLRWYDVGGA